MKEYIKNQFNDRSQTLPVLSFPCTQKMNISVTDLVTSSDYQVQAMKMIEESFPVSVLSSPMDLSVEAEAFGAKIRYSDGEIPTVIGAVVQDIAEVESLVVPEVGAGRTGIFIDAIAKAKKSLNKPVFAGTIGPYSLAGRLLDMTELMMNCYDEPELVHIALEKCTEFILKYIKALKRAGADGVLMAEPAAGLLSPAICEEFSSRYVKRIVQELRDDSFVFVYHNCGNVVPLYQSLIDIDADVYHFGNAIDIEEMLKILPKDKLVMGNIDPILIKDASKETITRETTALLNRCGHYENYVISTGCDLPPATPWDNIATYFEAIVKYHKK